MNEIVKKIGEELIYSSQHLEKSLVNKIKKMANFYQGKNEAASELLKAILLNLELSEKHNIPMCQDSGMVIVFAEVGENSRYSLKEIEELINQGISYAFEKGNFRASIVDEPLFNRNNTKTNLPPVIHWEASKGDKVVIKFILKGFGSENCSTLTMLNPTATKDDVIKSVVKSVKAAGGKPCPPIVVGVGLGGSSEQALLLSKKALLREVGQPNPSIQYAKLEKEIFEEVNKLNIGPGGFGGELTALDVAIEHSPTHIAGMPVGVSISCWADRKGVVSFD